MKPCPRQIKRPQRPLDDYLEAAVAAAAAAASAAALAASAAASAVALAPSTVAEAAVAAAEVAASAAELAASTAALAAWLAAAAASAASAAGAAAGASTGAGAGATSSFLPQADRATAATRAARTTEFFISVSYLDRQIKKISPSVPLFLKAARQGQTEHAFNRHAPRFNSQPHIIGIIFVNSGFHQRETKVFALL